MPMQSLGQSRPALIRNLWRLQPPVPALIPPRRRLAQLCLFQPASAGAVTPMEVPRPAPWAGRPPLLGAEAALVRAGAHLPRGPVMCS